MADHVLVTGAGGFVGRRLVRMLAEQGTEVVALVRRTSRTDGLRHRNVRLAEVDLANGRGLAALDLSRIATVFHLAATTSARQPSGYYRMNTGGTHHLLRTLREQTCPPGLVLCSSLAAAGPSEVTSGRAPVSHYGRSKLAAESLVRSSGIPATIVRPPIVHGPGDAGFIPSLLAVARTRITLLPGGEGARYSLLHVDDLCRFLIAVAETGRVGSGEAVGRYEPSDNRTYTGDELLATFCRALGHPEPRVRRVGPKAVSAAACLSELGGRLRGRVPVLNRDKARELPHSWVCTETPDDAALGFRPGLDLSRGIVDFLADRRGTSALTAPAPFAEPFPLDRPRPKRKHLY